MMQPSKRFLSGIDAGEKVRSRGRVNPFYSTFNQFRAGVVVFRKN